MSELPRHVLDYNRVVLVAPVVYRGRAYPCVGLGYIGAHLDRHGVRVRIVDTNFTGEHAPTAIAEEKPCIVGITCEARNVREALALAETAKAAGHTTVLGGLHVSLVRGEILQHKAVDFAIHGEGEEAMLALVRALQTGSELLGIQGLIYRKPPAPSHEPCIVVTPKGEAPRALDSLALPAYDLAGIHEIYEYPLITSRHCPYDCTFCTVGTISTRGQWLARRPEQLIEELIHARRKYNIKRFFVADEMFSLDLKRVKKFCQLLIKKKNTMRWGVMEGLRADRVDAELCELLLRAGCDWVVFGIETVSPEVFQSISKGERLSKIHEAIRVAKSSGIKVGGYFVVGLPHSTFEADMAAVRYAREARLDNAVFWMANPYYGTPMHAWVRENATLLREPIGDNVVNSLSTRPLFETRKYPAHLIKKAHAIANLRMGYHSFYDEPVPVTRWQKVKHRLRVAAMILRYDAGLLPRYVFHPDRIVPWKHGQTISEGRPPGWFRWPEQRRPDALARPTTARTGDNVDV